MSKVIVFGASGLLGASLVPFLRKIGYEVLLQGRSKNSIIQINPYEEAMVAQMLAKYRPDVVVNLIANTNVDQCELNPELAWQANAEVVRIISKSIIAQEYIYGKRPHLIQISTDQVYSGRGPHKEEIINPINVYGLSKYTGELLAESIGATILRTNFYGRSCCSTRKSFSDWLVNNMRSVIPMTVFKDVRFSALHINTLCEIIARCIELKPEGTFNVGCINSISKAEFALAIARILRLPSDNITIGSMEDVELNARRPFDMSMHVALIEEKIGFKCPQIQEEIEYTANEYKYD